jgi:hypothetical protein
LLLVEARGHVFLAPDNGLLARLIDSEPLVVVRAVGASAPVRGPSTTFDGRDRFAPLAARLVEGDPPAAFGAAGVKGFAKLPARGPERRDDGSLVTRVVHVDRFGNLITDLPFIWLAEAGADWRERWICEAGGERFPLVRTYAEAPGRGPVALVNSYDRMEVALLNGSAARELGLARGAEVRFVSLARKRVPPKKEAPARPPKKARKS